MLVLITAWLRIIFQGAVCSGRHAIMYTVIYNQSYFSNRPPPHVDFNMHHLESYKAANSLPRFGTFDVNDLSLLRTPLCQR